MSQHNVGSMQPMLNAVNSKATEFLPKQRTRKCSLPPYPTSV